MKDTTQNGDAGKSPPWGKVLADAARDTRFRTRPTHYAVYIAVTSHARWVDAEGNPLPKGHPDRGKAWPSMKSLQGAFGLAKGTLSEATRDIAAWGYWNIIPRSTRSKGRPGNCYLVAEQIALPAEFDASNKFTSDRTQTSSPWNELRSSTQAEPQSSAPTEPQSSHHRTTEENRSSGTDQSDQTTSDQTIIHTHAPAAASQAAGDGRIKISLDLAAPDQIYRMKAFRDLADGEQRANAAWREFLADRLREDPNWIAAYPNTYSGRFRDWYRSRSYQREREQREREGQAKRKMSWDWKKRPEFISEIWPFALRQGFTEDDALLQLDAFVRDRMGKGAEKTPLEWKMDAANWLERGMQYCLQNGSYVKRGQEEQIDDEIPF